jgi:TRAP-type C4-dicarboxylate transport system substrate-binding protein
MKKKIMFGVVVVFVSILAMPVSNSFAKDKSKEVIINWADVGPPTGLRPTYMKKAAEEVERVTEGRVKIKFFWSQSLLKVKDVPSGIRDGFADAGWVGSVYHPSELPLLGCLTTFLYTPKGHDAYWLAKKGWELYDKFPPLHEELEKLNAKIWMLFVYPSYPMFSNFRATKLKDLSGHVLRVSGESFVKMTEAIGARAEMISAGETYSALDKNIVDGAICGIDWGKGYSLYEVSDYVVLLDVFSFLTQGIVSMKKLDMMSDADRNAFLEIGRKYTLLYANAHNKQRDSLLDFYKDGGLEIVQFPRSEREKWAQIKAVKEIPKKWVQKQEKAGRPGEAMMKVAIETMGLSDIISLE